MKYETNFFLTRLQQGEKREWFLFCLDESNQKPDKTNNLY